MFSAEIVPVATRSIVLSPSWYVAVIFVSVLPENIAPTVSAIYSFKAVPSTVYASASNVPSISALPEISKLVASTSPATVSTPLVKVRRSVSPVCPIVVPSMAMLSMVKAVNVPSEVIFVCAAPVTVAAVPETLPVTSPVKGPAKASEVTVPSK